LKNNIYTVRFALLSCVIILIPIIVTLYRYYPDNLFDLNMYELTYIFIYNSINIKMYQLQEEDAHV